MSKKSSFLFLAIGAVAGWTAKGIFEEQSAGAFASPQPYAPPQSYTTPEAEPQLPSWESRPDTPPVRPVATGGDPFRGAFAGALAEIEAKNLEEDRDEEEEPDTQVA